MVDEKPKACEFLEHDELEVPNSHHVHPGFPFLVIAGPRGVSDGSLCDSTDAST